MSCSCFKNLDIFGSQVKLTISGMDSLKSTVGGFLSIILMIISIIIIFALLITSIFDKSGNIISYKVPNEYFMPQTLKMDEDIIISFLLIDKLYNPIHYNEDAHDIKLNIANIKRDEYKITKNDSYLSFPAMNCTPSFINENFDLNDTKYKDYLICIKYRNYEIKYEGDIIKDGEVNRPYFYFGPKKNIINNTSFTNLSNIIIMVNYQIAQILNINEPIKRIQRYFSFPLGNKVKMNIINLNFSSYDSLIPFMPPTNRSIKSLESFNVIETLNTGFILQINMSDNSEFIYRRFDRIDLYLSKFMGTFNIIYLIFYYLNEYLTRYYLNFKLINQFFRIDEEAIEKIKDKFKKKKLDNNSIKLQNLNNEFTNFDNSVLKFEYSTELEAWEKEDFYKRLSEFYKKISKKILSKSFSRILCSKKDKLNNVLFEKYSKILLNYFDYEYLLKIMSDVNKLKSIFMTTDQKRIFDYYYPNHYLVDKPQIFPDESLLTASNFYYLFNKSDSFMVNFINEKLIKTLNLEIASYAE